MPSKGTVHSTRIFKEPKDLKKAWDNYKLDLKEQAKDWESIQYVGKDGDKKTDHPKLPLTMAGFETYCYKHHGSVHQYFNNKEGYYESFVPICRAILTEIRADQINGGMLGFYNSSITQRLNGLTEKTETIISEPRVFNIPKD